MEEGRKEGRKEGQVAHLPLAVVLFLLSAFIDGVLQGLSEKKEISDRLVV